MRVVLCRFQKELFAVCLMVLSRGCLCGERRCDAFGVRHFQGTINLVRGDVVETLPLVAFWARLPVEPGSLQQ